METTYTPKALSADQLRSLIQEVKQALTELYADRLDRVILYGSYARGDFHAESDVDVMVVLKDEQVQNSSEFDKYWDIIWNLWQKTGVWVSIKIVSRLKYDSSDLFFYRNIREEGVVL